MIQEPRESVEPKSKKAIGMAIGIGIVVAGLLVALLRTNSSESSSSKAPSHAGAVVTGSVAAKTEAQVASQGKDGEFVTAPVRPVDSLVDVQSPSVSVSRGEKVSAWGTVKRQQTPELALNELDEFPRIYVSPGEEAAVRMRWPQAAPGDRVVAAVEDGGQLGGGARVKALELDANQELSFAFVAGMEPGIYRISVRRGAETKTVQFWASNDPKLSINR
jgi:hypothetical protein